MLFTPNHINWKKANKFVLTNTNYINPIDEKHTNPNCLGLCMKLLSNDNCN